MVSLNVPDELYRQIEEQAKRSGRSPMDQARIMLEKALADELAEAQLLAEVRQGRVAHPDLFLTEPELQRAKRWGRP